MSKFKVKLIDGKDSEGIIVLPFPPFNGLNVSVPFRDGDFMEIDGIFWDEEEQRFDAFLLDE